MLYLNGKLRGKPGTAQRAHAAWQEMAGGSGELYTGHCVVRVRDGGIIDVGDEFCCTTVQFATPDAEDLDAYVASGEPLAVAGGFTLDGLGGWFIDGVDGDPSGVIGIGLPLTRRLLERVGLPVPALWQANPPD